MQYAQRRASQSASTASATRTRAPDAQDQVGNHALLAQLATVQEQMPSDVLSMVGGSSAPLDLMDLGGDVMAGMEELGRSPSVSGSDGTGAWDIGYRMTMEDAKAQVGAAAQALKDASPEGKQDAFAEWQRLHLQLSDVKDWRNGHANDGGLFFVESNPSDGQRFSWELQGGVSGSAALQNWLEGPTIADCASTIVAIQLEALRREMGDAAFDAMCDNLPSNVQYFICPDPMKTPLAAVLSDIDLYNSEEKGTAGARPGLQPGDSVYIANHPDYSGGSYGGENAIYMGLNANGEQTFQGFGMTRPMTEMELVTMLAAEYTTQMGQPMTAAQVLAAGGGLQTEARPDQGNAGGKRLDADKVAALKEQYGR